MVSQGRNQSGKFESKSDELRSVRTIRLTDSAWKKLGEISISRDITRADLIEEWAKQDFLQQLNQPTSSGATGLGCTSGKEVITRDTRKTGTELAHRLTVSSAALTNWLKFETFFEKSQAKDPDRIAWEREKTTKKYRPILESN